MKKCLKCGCTEFTASQVQKHRVIVNGNGKFIRNNELYSEDPIMGPYVCCSCGAEYQRLDELTDEVEYYGFGIYNCTNSVPYAFPKGPVSEKNLIKALHNFVRDQELPCGYYLFAATSDDGRSKRSGMIRVSNDPFGNKKVDLAEEWKEYDIISMPAFSEQMHVCIESKGGKSKNLYVVKTEDGKEYVFNAYPKVRKIDSISIEIETIDPFVTYKRLISPSVYDRITVRYKCCDPDSYDPDARILYSSCEMHETYRNKVDKNEYTDFDCWLADMLKSGVFVKL